MIGHLSNQTFDHLVSIGKLITDFRDASGDSAVAAAPSGADGMDTTLDDDIGVAVEFEESDEEEDSDLDQVSDLLSLLVLEPFCASLLSYTEEILIVAFFSH
jgi:pre-mRNA-splicing helicase BRR2